MLGEAGVGKSRLLAEVQRRLDGLVLVGHCQPYGEGVSYAPLEQALRTATRVGPDVPAAPVRSRLDGLVADLALDPVAARHLALLTGLDDDSDRAAGLVDERTLHAAFVRWLEALARRQPVCLVLEDAHWADDALLDLVQAATRRARDVPVLVLALARPELVERHPGWGRALARFSSASLAPLDAASTARLVEELASAHGLSPYELAAIVERSGGVPLFAEELVAAVAEGATGVPATLSSLLLARLDALPEAQQDVLRRASVLGTTFWAEGVVALGTDPAHVDEALADLEQRDLLRGDQQTSLPRLTGWSFKHALVRDAAYASLPKKARRELHGAAADWLDGIAGDRRPELSEQLAVHATAAERPVEAVQHLLRAAERARHAASHRREAALLASAATLAEQLQDQAQLAEIRARRGVALSRLALWAEAREELAEALAGLPVDAVRRRAEVCCDLSTASFWLLDTPGVAEYAEQGLELAQSVAARDVELAARAQLTNAHSANGDVARVLEEGRALLRDAASWGEPPPYSRLGTYSLQLYLTGEPTAVEVSRSAVQSGLAAGDTQGVLWNLPHVGMAAAAAGRFDEALAVFTEARRFGEEHELHAGLPRAIAMSAGFHLDLFDHVGAEAIQQEARERGREHFPPSAVSAGIDLMLNLVRRGDVGPAELMVDPLGEEVSNGSGWHGWLWRLRFAQARAELAFARGDLERSLELAEVSRGLSAAKSRTKYEAWARMTAGQALLALGRKHDALAELHGACGLAAHLGHPALQVSASAAALAAEPDADIAAQGRGAIELALAGLSDVWLRERFLASDPVSTILRVGT